jgi:hypothetical protein
MKGKKALHYRLYYFYQYNVLYYILENPRENHATDMEASYMDAQKKFKFWLHNDFFDNETKAELKKIKDDLEEITLKVQWPHKYTACT